MRVQFVSTFNIQSWAIFCFLCKSLFVISGEIISIEESIAGSGFHLDKVLNIEADLHASSWLCIYQQFPRELFIDRFQLQRYYSLMYFQSKGLDRYLQFKHVWLSSPPDLEAPSCRATAFETLLYFYIIESPENRM